MNLDLSTAPEIAQLAGQGAPLEPFGCKKGGNRLTAGSLNELLLDVYPRKITVLDRKDVRPLSPRCGT